MCRLAAKDRITFTDRQHRLHIDSLHSTVRDVLWIAKQQPASLAGLNLKMQQFAMLEINCMPGEII